MKILDFISILLLFVFTSQVTVGQKKDYNVDQTVGGINLGISALKDCRYYININNQTVANNALEEIKNINSQDIRLTKRETLQNNKAKLSELKESIESFAKAENCNSTVDLARLLGNIKTLLKRIDEVNNPGSGAKNEPRSGQSALKDFKDFPINTEENRLAFKEKLKNTLISYGNNSPFAKGIYEISDKFYDQPGSKNSSQPYSVSSKVDSVNTWLHDTTFIAALSKKLPQVKDTIVKEAIRRVVGITVQETGFKWPDLLLSLLAGLLIAGSTVWVMKPKEPYFEIISQTEISIAPGIPTKVNWKASKDLKVDIKHALSEQLVFDSPYRSEDGAATFIPTTSGIYTITATGKKSFKIERIISITLAGQDQTPPATGVSSNPVEAQEPSKTQIEYINLKPQRDNEKYFFAEAFTTAGPRKSNRDDELGEDIAGVLVCEDYALFWILDGVSDYDVLKTEKGNELFSSRLLAQTIAWRIQAKIAEKMSGKISDPDGVELKELLTKAVEEAREEIENSIRKILGADRSRAKELYEQNKDGYRAATTATLGYLDKKGNLRVAKIGDDKLLMLSSGKLISPKTDRTQSGRFAVKLSIDPNGYTEINSYEVDDLSFITYSEPDVSSIIATTDGVSDNLLNMLKALPDADFQSQQVREYIGRMKSGTSDDKALCVVQLKKTNA